MKPSAFETTSGAKERCDQLQARDSAGLVTNVAGTQHESI
jgi:hypothetical protein